VEAAFKEMFLQFEAEAAHAQMEEWDKRQSKIDARARRKRWSAREHERHIREAFREQEESNKRNELARHRYYDEKKEEMRAKYSWFCIFDDLSYSKEAMRSIQIAHAVKNGRHYIMQQFYACQGVRDFKCDNRDQIDVLAFAPNITVSNMKRFIEDFMPGGIKEKQFQAILAVFAKYGWWLVVERRNVSSFDPHDYIFRYRARWEPVVREKVGSPEYKWIHDVLFDHQKAARTVIRSDPATLTSKRNMSKNMRQRAVEAASRKEDDMARLFAAMGPRHENARLREAEEKRIARKRAQERRTEASYSRSHSSDNDDPNYDSRTPVSRHSSPPSHYNSEPTSRAPPSQSQQPSRPSPSSHPSPPPLRQPDWNDLRTPQSHDPNMSARPPFRVEQGGSYSERDRWPPANRHDLPFVPGGPPPFDPTYRNDRPPQNPNDRWEQPPPSWDRHMMRSENGDPRFQERTTPFSAPWSPPPPPQSEFGQSGRYDPLYSKFNSPPPPHIPPQFAAHSNYGQPSLVW
jgi:hypothetical protein